MEKHSNCIKERLEFSSLFVLVVKKEEELAEMLEN